VSDPETVPEWPHDVAYDAGDTGCGEVLLDLRIRFANLRPGTRVLVTARDPGAPIEMPAWCRLTGHTLLEAAHPHYVIRKRTES
jgi:tRNA 2-thiouridine synthesizing protein A